jgi:hypothetical protein
MNIKHERTNTSLEGLRLTDDHRDLAICIMWLRRATHWPRLACIANFIASLGAFCWVIDQRRTRRIPGFY